MGLDVADLPTPALLVEASALDHNLASMSRALPGRRLRPHVKAHKCTEIARRQSQLGHRGFTCATLREMEGLAAAGLGDDLLLANEVLDARRLGALDARVTLAVDSPETIDAAVAGGVREVLIDVNVGLPRCGCDPLLAGSLADRARRAGLEVRGVMGYEGHAMLIEDATERARVVGESMKLLEAAHSDVGGDIVSAGGTGSYACNEFATEIQAGSYVLMDTAYAKLDSPFVPALSLAATVISRSSDYAVADCGLKALGMDHGNPATPGYRVWFCSDEHITFGRLEPETEGAAAAAGPEAAELPHVGDRIRVIPAHVDPTVAYHERMHLISGDSVLKSWPVDLRGW